MKNIQDFKGQNYEQLKKSCHASKEPFIDPIFDTSLCLSGDKFINGTIVWKRITEISATPKFFDETSKSRAMSCGIISNNWLISAISAITSSKELWGACVPDHKAQQDSLSEGIFHFHFWQFGHWIDVVVDDFLPTIENKVVSTYSNNENEFWVSLYEKAYAKLCGSYSAMDKGNLGDALVDFTSGFSEVVKIKTDQKENGNGIGEKEIIATLKQQLFRTREEHGLICCSIPSAGAMHPELKTKTGLIKNHHYVLNSIKEIHLDSAGHQSVFKVGEKVLLLRLRHPWGTTKWNGAFNTNSFEWTRISEGDRDKLGLVFEDKGEFWMTLEDFVTEFTQLTLCHLINHSIFHWKKTWNEVLVLGGWARPNHAGGCPTHETFLKNPQYYFDIPTPNVELIVQLVQKEGGAENDNEYTRVGFHIMKVEENREHRIHKPKKKVVTSDYTKGRSVLWRGSLSKGRHAIIPTTCEPNISAEFLLRIHSEEEQLKVIELVNDHPEPLWIFGSCTTPPMTVTTITVEGATGLAECENTFCVIKSEGESLKSEIIHNSQKPQWGLQGVFFRKDVCKPIVVEVWESKPHSIDKFLGCATLSGESENQVVSVKKSLVGKGRKHAERHPGELTILIATYDDLNAT